MSGFISLPLTFDPTQDTLVVGYHVNGVSAKRDLFHLIPRGVEELEYVNGRNGRRLNIVMSTIRKVLVKNWKIEKKIIIINSQCDVDLILEDMDFDDGQVINESANKVITVHYKSHVTTVLCQSFKIIKAELQ
jgi:hypothetical protein